MTSIASRGPFAPTGVACAMATAFNFPVRLVSTLWKAEKTAFAASAPRQSNRKYVESPWGTLTRSNT